MNEPTPKIYRTTNWPSYNRALINRGNISIWFDPKTQWYAQPQGKHGRNQTYSDTAIQSSFERAKDLLKANHELKVNNADRDMLMNLLENPRPANA